MWTAQLAGDSLEPWPGRYIADMPLPMGVLFAQRDLESVRLQASGTAVYTRIYLCRNNKLSKRKYATAQEILIDTVEVFRVTRRIVW
jgi:hypothetical protein